MNICLHSPSIKVAVYTAEIRQLALSEGPPLANAASARVPARVGGGRRCATLRCRRQTAPKELAGGPGIPAQTTPALVKELGATGFSFSLQSQILKKKVIFFFSKYFSIICKKCIFFLNLGLYCFILE